MRSGFSGMSDPPRPKRSRLAPAHRNRPGRSPRRLRPLRPLSPGRSLYRDGCSSIVPHAQRRRRRPSGSGGRRPAGIRASGDSTAACGAVGSQAAAVEASPVDHLCRRRGRGRPLPVRSQPGGGLARRRPVRRPRSGNGDAGGPSKDRDGLGDISVPPNAVSLRFGREPQPGAVMGTVCRSWLIVGRESKVVNRGRSARPLAFPLLRFLHSPPPRFPSSPPPRFPVSHSITRSGGMPSRSRL